MGKWKSMEQKLAPAVQCSVYFIQGKKNKRCPFKLIYKNANFVQIICTIYLHTQAGSFAGTEYIYCAHTRAEMGGGDAQFRMTSHEWTDHTGWLLKFDNRGFECCPVTTATHTCKPILQAQQLKLHQQTN